MRRPGAKCREQAAAPWHHLCAQPAVPAPQPLPAQPPTAASPRPPDVVLDGTVHCREGEGCAARRAAGVGDDGFGGRADGECVGGIRVGLAVYIGGAHYEPVLPAWQRQGLAVGLCAGGGEREGCHLGCFVRLQQHCPVGRPNLRIDVGRAAWSAAGVEGAGISDAGTATAAPATRSHRTPGVQPEHTSLCTHPASLPAHLNVTTAWPALAATLMPVAASGSPTMTVPDAPSALATPKVLSAVTRNSHAPRSRAIWCGPPLVFTTAGDAVPPLTGTIE